MRITIYTKSKKEVLSAIRVIEAYSDAITRISTSSKTALTINDDYMPAKITYNPFSNSNILAGYKLDIADMPFTKIIIDYEANASKSKVINDKLEMLKAPPCIDC